MFVFVGAADAVCGFDVISGGLRFVAGACCLI